MSVSQVTALRAQGDNAGALALALDEWRRTRHPLVADVVDFLSGECLKSFEAPKTRSNEAFQHAWLSAFPEPGAVEAGWLASTVGLKLSGSSAPLSSFGERLSARLTRVKAAPADPRYTRAMLPWLLDGHETLALLPSLGLDLFGPWFVSVGDARAISALETAHASAGRWPLRFRERQRVLVQSVLAGLKALPAAEAIDEPAWRALLPLAAPPMSAHDRQTLLDQLATNRADDTPRLVLADLLTEHADPRGEFISIQVAQARGTATEQQAKRARALLKAHKNAWLGVLGDVLSVDFSRGFPSCIELKDNASADEDRWVAAAASPLLKTVDTVLMGQGNVRHTRQFLESPQLTGLRELDLPSYAELAVLLARPELSGTLEHLHVPIRGLQTWGARLGDLPLPNLHTLTLKGWFDDAEATLEALSNTNLLKRIAHLRREDGATSHVWLPLLEAHSTLKSLEFVARMSDLGQKFERTDLGLVHTIAPVSASHAVTVLQRSGLRPDEIRIRRTKRALPDPRAVRALEQLGARVSFVDER